MRTDRIWIFVFVALTACGAREGESDAGGAPSGIEARMRAHAEIAGESFPPAKQLTDELVVGIYEQDVRWIVNLMRGTSANGKDPKELAASVGSTLFVEADHTFRNVRESRRAVLGRGTWRVDGETLHLDFGSHERVATLHGEALRMWNPMMGQDGGVTTWRRR